MAPIRLQPVFTDLAKLASTGSSDEIKALWTIVTKAKDSIDYGYRLENLSWRLWYSSTHPTSPSSSSSQAAAAKVSVPNNSGVVVGSNLKRQQGNSHLKQQQHIQNIKLKATIINSFSHILEEIQLASHAPSFCPSTPGHQNEISRPRKTSPAKSATSKQNEQKLRSTNNRKEPPTSAQVKMSNMNSATVSTTSSSSTAALDDPRSPSVASKRPKSCHHVSGFKNLDQFFTLATVKASDSSLDNITSDEQNRKASRQPTRNINISSAAAATTDKVDFFVPCSESPITDIPHTHFAKFRGVSEQPQQKQPEINMSDLIPKHVMLTSVQSSSSIQPGSSCCSGQKTSLLSSMIKKSNPNQQSPSSDCIVASASEASLSPCVGDRQDLLQDALPISRNSSMIIGHRRYSSASSSPHHNASASVEGVHGRGLASNVSVDLSDDNRALFEIW